MTLGALLRCSTQASSAGEESRKSLELPQAQRWDAATLTARRHTSFSLDLLNRQRAVQATFGHDGALLILGKQAISSI